MIPVQSFEINIFLVIAMMPKEKKAFWRPKMPHLVSFILVIRSR